jgi:hypothetical protein
MTSTAWWVVVPPAEASASTRPADAQIVSTQVGSTAYNALLNGGNASVNGGTWARFQGPFGSETLAKNAVVGPITIGDWVGAGVAGSLIGGVGATPAAAVGAGAAAGTGVDAVASGWKLAFGGDLRKLMLRIAEGLIGGILIIMALESAMKETGTGNIVQAAKKYGKVALAA